MNLFISIHWAIAYYYLINLRLTCLVFSYWRSINNGSSRIVWVKRFTIVKTKSFERKTINMTACVSQYASLIHSYIQRFIISFIRHSFIHAIILFMYPFILSFIHVCIHSLTQSINQSLHQNLYTFFHSFIHFFIHQSLFQLKAMFINNVATLNKF